MEKDFVPYQPSLDMKEIGFDDPCFYQYVRDFDNDGELIPIVSDNNYPILRNNTQVSSCSGGDCFAAPTFSTAFRWFRKKYNLKSWIQEHTADTFIYEIRPHKLTDYKEGEVYVYDVYEEAELACIKKLIEISKNK